MKTYQYSLFLLAILGWASASSYAGFVYEYDWVGGQPDFSGRIFLDAPSSPVEGGTLNDILFATATTPYGTFTFDPANLTGFASVIPSTAFTWTPTAITEMRFAFWNGNIQNWMWVGPSGPPLSMRKDQGNYLGSVHDFGHFESAVYDDTGSWAHGHALSDSDSTFQTMLLAGTVLAAAAWKLGRFTT